MNEKRKQFIEQFAIQVSGIKENKERQRKQFDEQTKNMKPTIGEIADGYRSFISDLGEGFLEIAENYNMCLEIAKTYEIIGDVKLPTSIMSIPVNITPAFMQTDFAGLLHKNFIPMFFVIFLLINIDTAGAIVSLTYKSKKKNESLKKPMIADSLAVITAPIFGTTASGVFLDSMTGIQAGGRTGLTAITVGILFILGTLFSPILSIIPPYAYAPALLYVGILMTSAVLHIDYNDITEFAPAIFIIATMIFTYNIGIGIMSGFLIYPIIQLLCGQKQKTNTICWIMFAFSVLFFIIYPY